MKQYNSLADSFYNWHYEKKDQDYINQDDKQKGLKQHIWQYKETIRTQ